MKSLIFLLSLISCTPAYADTKIGDLPLGSASATGVNDSFPYVNATANTTERLKLSDLINLPSMQTEFLTLIPAQFGQNGKCLVSNGSNTFWTACSGSSTEAANLVYAGPVSGSAALPTFRSLVGADLPAPTSISLGGVESYGAVTHQWLDSISTLGVPSSSRPACGDLSNSAASCSTDTTNASNITSGVLVASVGGTGVTSLGTLSDAGTDGIVVTNGLGATIINTSLAQHVADSSHNGYLSFTDWTSFNAVTGAATSVGAFGSSPNTAGLSLSSNVLTMQPADGTRPGGVSIAAQTFAGVKTFSSAPTFSSLGAGVLRSTSGGAVSSSELSGDVTTSGSNATSLVATSNSTLTTLPALTTAITLASIGTVTSGSWTASKIGLAYGGTNANLSATGGTSQVLMQSTSGGNVTVSQLACSNLSNAAASCSTDATNASNITTGTLAKAQGGFGTSVAAVTGLPHFVSGTLSFSSVSLNNTSDVTGTLPVANGGTGTASTPTNGQLLIGNGSGYSLATLTQGSNITITNGSGTIQIDAGASANPAYNTVSKTAAYNAVISDWVLASSASFTITLPTAVGQNGKQIVVQHAGTSLTQVYTLNTTSSQSIAGLASGVYKLYTTGEVVTLSSDNANWQVINHIARTAWTTVGTLTLSATTTAPTAATSPTENRIQWYRDGNTACERASYRQTAATGAADGSGVYIFSHVTNLSPDSTQVSNMGACSAANLSSSGNAAIEGYTSLGHGYYADGTNRGVLVGLGCDSTHFSLYNTQTGNAIQAGSSGGFATLSTFSWSVEMCFPVPGWQP